MAFRLESSLDKEPNVKKIKEELFEEKRKTNILKKS